MTITDEMVEKAADAYGAYGPGNRNKFHDSNMRAAIEAVAPMLIAKWLHGEADKVTTKNISWYLTARAHELEQK